MGKKEFLKSLEKKLAILDEQEVKDIVNEYEDIIDEKVKDGKTEEEAVKEFGSLEELTSEILKTYKLNSKYTKENEPVKNAVNGFEDGVKKLSHDMADFFKNTNNGNGISIELVCELIIKFLVLLVILAILRLPFELLIELGKGILDITFYPVNEVLGAFWHIGVIALYFVVSALIFIALFKQYFTNNKTNKVSNTKNSKISTKVKEEKKVKEEIREEKGLNVEVNQRPNTFEAIISSIYKVFMVMIFLIPLWLTIFGLSVALCIIIYYTIIGINIWGLIILFIGLLMGFGWLETFFYAITFNTKKITIMPLFLSIIITTVGGLAFANNMLTFDYIETNDKLSNVEYTTYKEELEVPDTTKIRYYNAKNIEYIVDDTIEDNKIIIEIEYPIDIVKVNDILLFQNSDHYYIDFDMYTSDSFGTFKKVYNQVINALKNGEIYSYYDEYFSVITITGNTNTLNSIKN